MKRITKTNKIKTIIHILILVLFIIIILGTTYIKLYFGNETIGEFIFYLTNGVGNGDMGIYLVAIKMCFPFFLILLFLLISLFYNILIDKKIMVRFKKKSFKIYPFNFIRNHKVIFTTIFGVISLAIAIVNLDLHNYYKNITSESPFIKDNYVMVPEDVSFPKKRNLIYIVVESLETTFFTKEQGGAWDYEVMPELYQLLSEEDSISFSANDKATGISVMSETGWTTAAIVANSTGLPFKIPIEGNSYHSNNFMNGAYAIGDLLKEHGYYNEVISGSSTSFGGIKEFYTKHGNFKIIDPESLASFGFKMKEADKGAWGFNDKYLFEIAKKRLEIAAKKDEPFNMNLICIDPHPNNGFIGNYSVDDYDVQYENVYATESKLVYNFINWVKQQKFYKDTTIVVVGDHLNMQTDFFKGKENQRYIYNVIINSAVKTDNIKNRIFTSVDMYPTTVAAIGGNIKGNQLGLGVNLFSDKQTLPEKYGLHEVNSNISKKSLFYNSYILGEDYLIMSSQDIEGGKEK